MQDTLNRAEQLANLLGGAMPELTRAEQLARIERVLRREDDRRKAARASNRAGRRRG